MALPESRDYTAIDGVTQYPATTDKKFQDLHVAGFTQYGMWQWIETWTSRDTSISADATYLEGSRFKSIITGGSLDFSIPVTSGWNATVCSLNPGTTNANVAGAWTGGRLCLPGAANAGSFRMEWSAT